MIHNTKVYINRTNYKEKLHQNINTRNEYLDSTAIKLMEH